jgi:hypothetical protein
MSSQAQKKVIQRNLSIDSNYTIISSNYIPLSDSFGICCDNCNKIIANLITIKDDAGQLFTVGLDCAKTLSSINVNDLKRHEVQIKKISSAVKKISALIKYGNEIVIFGNVVFKVYRQTYDKKPFFNLSLEFCANMDNMPDRIKQYVKTREQFLLENPEFIGNYYLKDK